MFFVNKCRTSPCHLANCANILPAWSYFNRLLYSLIFFVSISPLPSGVSQKWVLVLDYSNFSLFKLYWLFLPCRELPSLVYPFRCLPTTTASGQWMNLKKTSLQVSVTVLCDSVSSILLLPLWVIPPSWLRRSVAPSVLFMELKIWSSASWFEEPVANYQKSQITVANNEG